MIDASPTRRVSALTTPQFCRFLASQVRVFIDFLA
jgi:hypothetical protein